MLMLMVIDHWYKNNCFHFPIVFIGIEIDKNGNKKQKKSFKINTKGATRHWLKVFVNNRKSVFLKQIWKLKKTQEDYNI